MKQLNLLFASALMLAAGNLLCMQSGHPRTKTGHSRVTKSDRALWAALGRLKNATDPDRSGRGTPDPLDQEPVTYDHDVEDYELPSKEDHHTKKATGNKKHRPHSQQQRRLTNRQKHRQDLLESNPGN